MKPIVYLLCGLPGSGKTTRARELEAEETGEELDEWATWFESPTADELPSPVDTGQDD